jgi:hypothetical protein
MAWLIDDGSIGERVFGVKLRALDAETGCVL